MGRRTEQTFFQKGNADGRQAHKKFELLIIREMQAKTTIRHHFTPIRMATINKNKNNKH